MKIWNESSIFFCDERDACLAIGILNQRSANCSFGSARRARALLSRWLTSFCCTLVLFLFAGASAALCQNADEPSFPENVSPKGALWRAAVLPGWGQSYNRQYYKVPIVWAGLGGLAASAIIVNRNYLLYRHSYHFLARRENGEPVFPEYEADFLKLIDRLNITRERAEASVGAFRESRDNLRRNRDLLYIGIGLFYGITILDAYVNAHLLQFDVGEDLTLSVQPVVGGFSASLQFSR